MIAYYFHQKTFIRTIAGKRDKEWTIYEAPTEELRKAIAWNDSNGDFDHLERVDILEIFINDFIRG